MLILLFSREADLPQQCLLLVVFCVSWQHERQWLSQMWLGQRGWGLEDRPWPPLDWTNTNSIDKQRWEQRGKQKQGQKMLNTSTRALVYKMQSANILCTYIVAFSQEVKCKSICFCCCRNNRCISNTVKLQHSLQHSVKLTTNTQQVHLRKSVTKRQQSI